MSARDLFIPQPEPKLSDAERAKRAAAARARLPLLREAFAHSTGHQDWLARWWDGLRLDDRRLLLAFCGLDDGEDAARRPWQQHLLPVRDQLVSEGRRLRGLLDVLRWA